MPEPHAPPPPLRLRFWALSAALYGLLLAAAVIALLPWKSPAYNVGLLLYSALWVGSAPGLWSLRRWGWRLGLVAGFIGLVLLVFLSAGLLSSWAYLHAIYGDFGFGASIGALLFVSVALQVLGLVPGLFLRALLRREVRAQMGAGRALPRAAVLLLLVPLPVGLGVHSHYRYASHEPLSEAQQATALQILREAMRSGQAPAPENEALRAFRGVPTGAGPLYVTLWHRGQRLARVQAEGADFAQALREAAQALLAHPKVHGTSGRYGRLRLDRVVAAAPVPWADHPVVGPVIVALSVNAGLDGLRRVQEGSSAILLPDDLIKLQVFGHAPLIPGIRELRLGLDAKQVLQQLGLVGGRLERLRTEGAVESGDHKKDRALPVWRGNVPLDARGPAAWRQAAVEGGRFILRQMQKSGRFHYQYLPYSDRHPEVPLDRYSLPRHAGTVYALALLHGLTGQPQLRAGAERAIAWLDEQIPKSCGSPARACVVKPNQIADLGSASLTLVGMLEYRRQTQDTRYDETIRRLVAFVRSLQKEDGDFYHEYNVKTQEIVRKTRSMFYSEEAALALVMAHEALGEAEWLRDAERALDYLTGPKYGAFFLGRFIYGADHWTCIAADEVFDRLPKARYLDFCLGYSAFMARLQFDLRAGDNADFHGHYGFSQLMVPQAAAAGLTEAVLSTWSLAKKHGRDTRALAAQAGDALDALARESIRADNGWMMPRPRYAQGGIRRSLVEEEVRIDFTQHAASALIRGAQLGELEAQGAEGEPG